jgi:CHASE2 domain
MERPSIWVIIVVLLLGILFLREPRFQRSEEIFLHWLVRHSQPSIKSVPLTIVEVGKKNPPPPLETALLLQGLLQFKPTVVAIEPVLQWGERVKDQEQIFIDQAMRVPKLVLGAGLTATPDPDAPVPEITGFTKVTGRRGDLTEFSGIEHQPSEDVRVLSTLGFVNSPEEAADDLHVPLLFQYRGEVIPAFALQAVMLWLRATPDEVKIDIGSSIDLPAGIKIPIRADGTLLVNPRMEQRARRITIDELLLAAQQHESGAVSGIKLEDIRTQLVLARSAAQAPDFFAAAIATIQANTFVRRVSWIFDCVMVVLAAAMSGVLRRFSRIDLLIGAIAFSAAYCLIALGIVSRWSIWLPAFLPLGAAWISVLFAIILPKPKDSVRTVTVAAPPPAP